VTLETRGGGAGLLAEAVDMFAGQAAKKGIRLRLGGERLGASIRCDRGRILQVLSNLRR
jgi:signal transduction histidine kinase